MKNGLFAVTQVNVILPYPKLEHGKSSLFARLSMHEFSDVKCQNLPLLFVCVHIKDEINYFFMSAAFVFPLESMSYNLPSAATWLFN